MFNLAPNPVAVSLGPLDIRWYGIVYAAGFLFTYFYLKYQIKQGRLKLQPDHVDNLLLYLIIGVIVGGRVGETIIFSPQRFLADPLSLFKIWEGGMAFHGAIIGIALAFYFFCRKYNVKFYHLSDHITIPGTLFLFFGRIANFVNAELVGTVMNPPGVIAVNWWGETNAQGELVYRHPSQLYAAAKNLIMFTVLTITQSSKSFTRQFKIGSGFYTWLFIAMYGFLRFTTNYWRAEPRSIFGIMSTGQLLSLLMLLGALYVLFTKYLNKQNTKHKKHHA